MVSPQPITVNLNEHISCRLYNDTRPHCLETAALQKGLVLIVDGKEVIEEGVGFGVPVVLYKDEPYFSSSAECSILNDGNRKILVKSFVMDTVSRKRFGKNVYVNDGVYSLLHKAQQDLFGFRTCKNLSKPSQTGKAKVAIYGTPTGIKTNSFTVLYIREGEPSSSSREQEAVLAPPKGTAHRYATIYRFVSPF